MFSISAFFSLSFILIYTAISTKLSCKVIVKLYVYLKALYGVTGSTSAFKKKKISL